MTPLPLWEWGKPSEDRCFLKEALAEGFFLPSKWFLSRVRGGAGEQHHCHQPQSPASLSWGELIFIKTLHQDTESSVVLSRDPKPQSPAYLGISALVIVPQTIKVLSLGLRGRA